LKVAFLVDAGFRLGMGHLNRCLSLANSFSKKKVTSFFIISNKHIEQIIKSKNHNVTLLKQKQILQIKNFLQKNKISILIVDSKKKSTINTLKILRKYAKIIIIDNVKAAHFADLLILPGFKEQFGKFPLKSIVGPEYVLLNPNLKIKKRKIQKNSIFISMGSSDKLNITQCILTELIKTKSDFNTIIVVGQFYKKIKNLQNIIKNDNRFTILKNPHNFHEIMSSCSMGIITFGITIYETAAIGLPTFVISHSNENDRSAKRIEKYKLYTYLGKYNEINYSVIVKKLISVLQNKNKLKQMSAPKIIDGKGSTRICKSILELN